MRSAADKVPGAEVGTATAKSALARQVKANIGVHEIRTVLVAQVGVAIRVPIATDEVAAPIAVPVQVADIVPAVLIAIIAAAHANQATRGRRSCCHSSHRAQRAEAVRCSLPGRRSSATAVCA